MRQLRPSREHRGCLFLADSTYSWHELLHYLLNAYYRPYSDLHTCSHFPGNY